MCLLKLSQFSIIILYLKNFNIYFYNMNRRRGMLVQREQRLKQVGNCLPGHPRNLLSTFPPCPLASLPLPLIAQRSQDPALFSLFFSIVLRSFSMLCFASPTATIWFISPLVRVQQPSKSGGARHRPHRERGERLTCMKWVKSTWEAAMHRNLPHLHILLIKASAELSHWG